MDTLTVLYDATCPLCVRAAGWLAAQPQLVRLELVPAGTEHAVTRFPALDHQATRGQLTVISSDGAVYYDERGWLMCLWALRNHRSLALRLSSPALLPMARRFVLWVSRHRRRLGTVLAP